MSQEFPKDLLAIFYYRVDLKKHTDFTTCQLR